MTQKKGSKTSTFSVTLFSLLLLALPIIKSVLDNLPQNSAAAQIGVPIVMAVYAISRSETVKAWLNHDSAAQTVTVSAPIESISSTRITSDALKTAVVAAAPVALSEAIAALPEKERDEIHRVVSTMLAAKTGS